MKFHRTWTILIVLVVVVMVLVGWRSSPRTPYLSMQESNDRTASYIVSLYEPLNRQYVGYRPCDDDRAMELTMQPYLDNALFLMTVQSTSTGSVVAFQPIFYVSKTMFLNTTPSSQAPTCATFSPTITPTFETWQLRDARDPTVSILSPTTTSVKVFSSTDESFLFVSYTPTQPVRMSSRIDEASTLDIQIPNACSSTKGMMGMIRYQNLYLNHTSQVPVLSSVASSVLWQFQFSQNRLDDGYGATRTTIQSHPSSIEKDFPSWYLGWDDASACRMVQDNTTEWTFEIKSKRLLSYGIEMTGFLQHRGVYVTIDSQTKLATARTRPTASSPALSIILFNHYLVG